ncbi:TMV resistance protein N-like isoform X2 [Vigna radiata var. radiata]|uniref:TMV resistance protein N-like isoform X2 n=1 Tax=Vigna radiata var. radiata TaxID=3916 RepID=A0A1S3VA13_VIGRR|nr:TMV resistance protein N-like isoform X2 [Vigna radiata var. radiata]
MFCPYITKFSHLMYAFKRVILEKHSKELHTKLSHDKNWSMACPSGATHSPKLQISLDGMRAITGITGAGGSGKTTLAKAIYNKIHETFTEKSFIEDIGQVRRTRGHHRLQEQFLLDVLKTKVEIPSVDMGTRMIREGLTGKRVLIVLDDVTENFTLLDLWGCREWFGGGTVIIITTRDVDLPRILKVDSVFGIRLMNENESLELLSWHAFREAKPKEEYNYLAKGVVTHCGGLPLALEVIGNCLFKRTKEEWNSVLLKLEKIPLHNVQQKLKISFDGLRNQIEKNLFLDICCSFVGEGRAYVKKMLNGCGVDADSGIRVLIECSLIKVKRNSKLGMHPLLQEMGREIINEIYEEEFETEWLLRFDDVQYVLTDNTGRRAIERVPVKLRSVKREPSRILKHTENSDYISKKLRWISLDWFSSVPDKFYLHDAMTIHLKHSSLRFLLKEPQELSWLKVLNLSHSKYLTGTPDFSGLPSLEQLILKGCTGLREVHPSIGCLCNLTLLNLKDCTSLSNFPREIYKLISLETLILSGCSKIDLLERDVVRMESLITLIAENTIVKHVPFSIGSSKSIGHISLQGFERLSCNIFPSIIRSWMSPVMNPISYIHSLCMDIDNSWESIGPLLSSLVNLRSVLVQCDTEYQLSKQVKSILVEYFANSAESGISKQQFRSSFIGLGTYHEFFNAVSDNISEVLLNSDSCDVSLPVDNLPNWLAYMGEGNSVSFSVPWDRDMKGMALSVVHLSTGEIVATECLRSVLIVNYTKCTLQIHKYGTIISFNDIDWQGIMSNLGPEDRVEIFVTFGHGLVVKNTILYLICGESNYLKKEPESEKNYLLRFIMKIVMCDFW